MKLLMTAILGALLSLSAPAQTTLLLSIFSAQVKPDKTGEFDTMVKRLVDANRKHNGSNWIALAVEQGPGFTINFVSRHDSYAAMEKSDNAFVAAIAAVTGGPAGVPAFFREIDKTLTGSRSEVRMRRPDLSANLPSAEEGMKAVGKMRYLRTSVVRLRPGYVRDYEEQIKLLAAGTKNTVYVSRSTLGTDGIIYYISRYLNSLAELDDADQTALADSRRGRLRQIHQGAARFRRAHRDAALPRAARTQQSAARRRRRGPRVLESETPRCCQGETGGRRQQVAREVRFAAVPGYPGP